MWRWPSRPEEPSVTNLPDGSVATLSRAGGGIFELVFEPCDGATTCIVPDCQRSLLGHARLLMTASTATDTKGRSGMRVFSTDDKGET